MDANDDDNVKDPRCTQVTVMKVANIAVNMLIFIVIIALCNVLHMLLRPYSQPRIISEAIVTSISLLGIDCLHVYWRGFNFCI